MSSAPHSPDAARGALAAAGCYLAWGIFPLFWKQLAAVDATELIAHRHVWSLLFIAGVMAAGRGGQPLREALRSRSIVAWHALSGLLLTLNWLVFIWGVNHGRVIEASLGYFLVPLVNVAIGRFVLHERLRRSQWAAIALAAVGVLLMLIRVGYLPWVALSLAATFGMYGLLRKKSSVGPLVGLGLETLLLAPAALAYLLWRFSEGGGALGHVSAGAHVLLLSTGIVTAVPLILFAYGARRVRFATLGLLQYIGPTVQFALGAWMFREPVSADHLLAFSFIWAGLALYTVDNLWHQPRAATG